MDKEKEAFIEFMIDSEVLRFGSFVTKSGRNTPYFINTGNYKTGGQLSTLSKYYAGLIFKVCGSEFDSIFGPAYKGIPLAAATASALYNQYGIDKPYFFNRKEPKDHGEGGSLVGYIPNDYDRIIIIEDVITAGTAIREVMPLLKSCGRISVRNMFISVNRCEVGQNPRKTAVDEVFDELGITVNSIVSVFDIYEYIRKSEKYIEFIRSMEDYMNKYCSV